MPSDPTVTACVDFLNTVYTTRTPAYLFFVGKLQDKLGGDKRAIYKKCPEVGFIFITIGLTISETAQILIHEYAHHLAQSDHQFVMFELWKEYLIEKFREGFLDYYKGGGKDYDGERED
jgi:hypothetical protein